MGCGELLEPGRGQGEQLGDCGEIPVGVLDLCVTEVGRQGEDGMVEIHLFGIPAQESPAGKGMPEVMDSRRHALRGAGGWVSARRTEKVCSTAR